MCGRGDVCVRALLNAILLKYLQVLTMKHENKILHPFVGKYATWVDADLELGATAEQIAAAEADLGFSLPPSLRSLYTICNGITVPTPNEEIRLLSLEEAVFFFHLLTDFYKGVLPYIPEHFQFFPFTDFNNSNHYAVCCTEPLIGRIVHLPHDDFAYLAFRSLRSFLTTLWCVVNYEYHHDLLEDWCDFAQSNPARTLEDDAAGMELLRIASSPQTSIEWAHLWREWAAVLLAPERAREFWDIISTGDKNCRRVVVERLDHIEIPSAAVVLEQYRWSMLKLLPASQS